MTAFSRSAATPLLPTVVFEHLAADAGPINDKLARKIHKIREEQPLWKGKPRPWQTAPDLHQRPPFRPVVEMVEEAVRIANEALRWDLDGFAISGMWANILSAGEQHPVHAHGNNLYAGVYYVRSPAPDNDRIRFYHPTRAADVWRPRVAEWTVNNSTIWSYPAIEGLLLLFPAWLMHDVGVLGETGECISISFNVAPRGALEVPESLQHATYGG
jgi:uncharacterized protein (TIGR02466 family)